MWYAFGPSLSFSLSWEPNRTTPFPTVASVVACAFARGGFPDVVAMLDVMSSDDAYPETTQAPLATAATKNAHADAFTSACVSVAVRCRHKRVELHLDALALRMRRLPPITSPALIHH